jgi:hypothetical protein
LHGGRQLKAPAGLSSAAHIQQLQLLCFGQNELAPALQQQQQQ